MLRQLIFFTGSSQRLKLARVDLIFDNESLIEMLKLRGAAIAEKNEAEVKKIED